MYVILETGFPKERRDKIAMALQRQIAHSGMAVHRQDTRDVVEIAASAIETIFEMNGAKAIWEFVDFEDLLYSGQVDHEDQTLQIEAYHWLKVAKNKCDEVLSRWNESELLTVGIIVAGHHDAGGPQCPFKDEPHVIIRICDHFTEGKLRYYAKLMIPSNNSWKVQGSDEVAIGSQHEDDEDEGLAFAAYRIFRSKLISGFKGKPIDAE